MGSEMCIRDSLKTGKYRELDGKELNTLYEQIYKQIETVNIQADN